MPPKNKLTISYLAIATITLSLGMIAVLDLQGPYERWQYNRQKLEDGAIYSEIFGSHPPTNSFECRAEEANVRRKIDDLHELMRQADAQQPGSKEVSEAWKNWEAALEASHYCRKYIPGYTNKFAGPPEKRAGFFQTTIIPKYPI